ncbi:unnamed protein product [Victoria cruziana]
MALGLIGAVADGITLPVMLLIMKFMNNLGAGPSVFVARINQNRLMLLYMACASWVASFLEGFCWTRTDERQASRMRVRYLKAVLRQDVGYFDLKVSSTSEVVTNVSNDSLVIRDVLSEKVPKLIMNVSTFIGSYIEAFVLLWRLALAAFPLVVFLIIPGLMYGRILIGLARRMLEEYNKAAIIAEQAISSIRTVYSFVGESRTMSEFSKALDGSVRLGMKQGFAKGLAIGSNGITFAIWSFMAWYGSRLVMYQGAKGGTVFAVGASLAVGGLTLGTALSNMKYISEACSAGERIMEVINRTPEIDSDNMGGEVLGDVRGVIEPRTIIFQDFSLTVPADETLALVGGKPFATSIKENVRFGKEDAAEEEVEAAARAANAHIFISMLPQSYDTQVGERGVQMSGGQKQRIARAIIKCPRILLLDEATSALDSESERVVQEALDQARIGRTTIIVATRLSTIRNADTIAVVQAGQVMEVGSHDSLTEDEKGLYSSLVRLQQTKDKEDGQNSMGQENMRGATSRSMSGKMQKLSRSSSMDSSTSMQTDAIVIPSEAVSWKEALTGCLAAFAFGSIQPTYAFTMGSLISVFFLPNHSETEHRVKTYALVFVFLAIFSFLVNIIEHYHFSAMGDSLTKRIRERMISKTLTFEVGWFDEDKNSSGVICSRLAKDADVVRSLVGDRISLLVQTASAVAIACTMGLVIAWRLAIVMIAVQPIIIICYYARRVLLKNMSEKAIQSQDESCKLATEAVSNLRTVTAFSSQARILHMFQLAQEAPNRESAKQSWYAGVGLGTSQSLMACTWALDFCYGGRLISHGYIGAKQLLQTFFVLISTGRVIADAGSMTSDLAKGADAVKTVFSILDRYTRIEPDDPEGYKPDTLEVQIELKDLEVGKSTALVGQSGSGKSTIIGLIERFYDPIKGAVRIDGRDIRSYNLRSLRKYIALVGQEPTLFAGTIRENILYGRENATEAEMVDAAPAANAHDFIGSLKDGYETWCGDRGGSIIRGAKMRLRDSQSEKAVQEALDRVMVGRTSMVVAHRLTTIQNCDTVAVLENGRVVEKGSHGALC